MQKYKVVAEKYIEAKNEAHACALFQRELPLGAHACGAQQVHRATKIEQFDLSNDHPATPPPVQGFPDSVVRTIKTSEDARKWMMSDDYYVRSGDTAAYSNFIAKEVDRLKADIHCLIDDITSGQPRASVTPIPSWRRWPVVSTTSLLP